MTPLTVRPLLADDRPAWDVLWSGYLVFYEEDLPEHVTEETWRRLIDPGVDPHGFGAVDDAGRLVGIAHYLFHRSTWSVGPYCYLEDLYVDPGVRGAGVGQALFEAVYAAADAAGAERVYWLTQETNRTARRLYDRVGRLTPFIKYERG
jgi:GNAT superfamily N-acetyltransferase